MNEKTALVKSEFALFKQDPDEMSAAIHENMGNVAIGRFDLQKILVPSGTSGSFWSVAGAEGEKSVKDIEAIIVKWHDARQYYIKSMNEGSSGEPPDCASDDGVQGYGDPTGSGNIKTFDCAKCPLAQWGSGKKGRGQACKLQRVLYIVTPDKFLPMVLQIPTGSYNEIKKFFLNMLSEGISYYSAIVSFGLQKTANPDNTAYYVVVPKMVRRLNSDENEFISKYVKSFNGMQTDLK